MKPTILKLTDIVVKNRLRQENGDIDELAESIKQYGVIQPLVVNQDNMLIAGGRRYAACTKLGLTEVPVFYKETLSQQHLHILEVEENTRRKDFAWQERVLAIRETHKYYKAQNAIEGLKWGLRETGALLGQSVGNINFALTIADKLLNENPKGKYWACENLTEAWKLRMQEELDALNADLAKNQTSHISATSPTLDEGLIYNVPEETIVIPNSDSALSELNKEQARERYLSNPHNKAEEFEVYYTEKQSFDQSRYQLSLSWLHKVNCIEFMGLPQNAERFDSIITDPPYGIDMDMLSQQNTGIKDIESVKAEHEVESNKLLLHSFFDAAYKSLKPNSFLVLWCDYDLWDFLKECATTFGFKPCRWPVIWHKLHPCINQAATFNFTKNHECAMVCRKGNATLVKPSTTSVISAAHDDYKEQLGHPFVKPFDAWDFFIEHLTIEGQTILEPFAGRGSGVISFLQRNRKVVACESNEQHFNALVNNVKNHYLRINPKFTFI